MFRYCISMNNRVVDVLIVMFLVPVTEYTARRNEMEE